jgi:hypothetical protein
MSAFSVSTSMILPLPSSPHWAPTKIVFAIFFQGGTGFQPVSVLFDRQDACPTAIKIPGHESGAKQRGLCAKKLGKRANDVNSAKTKQAQKT